MSAEVHEHPHAHAHPHPHPHAVEPQNASAGQSSPVLDLGAGYGALILYTPPELLGAEIEISPLVDLQNRTHVAVLERQVGSRTLYAALYGDLPEGTYRLWDDAPDREHVVTIRGGEVTELDWS
jgi:hypothetical protein